MNHECELILDPHITSPFQEEFHEQCQGVAILVFNRKGEVLLVQENDEDPQYSRKKGHWNIVTETREPQERLKRTVVRAFFEELGSDYSHFFVIPGSYRETNGEYNASMGYSYKYRCICVVYDGDTDLPANITFQCASGEITDYRWVSLNVLDTYENIEVGARKVIEYYQGV